MAQAQLDLASRQAKENKNSEYIEPSGDENVENLAGCLDTRSSLTFPTNLQTVKEGKHIHMEKCSIGNYHLRTKAKTLRCTNDEHCAVQLHSAQGVLSDHTNNPLIAYQAQIAAALTDRLTRDFLDLYRECVLCEESFEKGSQILMHIKGHGGELGKVTHPSTVKLRLGKLEFRKRRNEPKMCYECYSTSPNDLALYIHHARYHQRNLNHPLICFSCCFPLFDETFDQHYENHHGSTCCGVRLTTMGKYIQHYIASHPKKLEEALGREELNFLYIITKNAGESQEYPWGTVSRLTSKKIGKFSEISKCNNVPGVRTERFRDLYIAGAGQNPHVDVILKYVKNYKLGYGISTAPPGRIVLEVEKLMSKRLAENIHKYIDKCYLTRENPLRSEVAGGSQTGLCPACMEREDHMDNLCIDKRNLGSVTHAYLHCKVDDTLLALQQGIVIGARDGALEYGPWGQYSYLNLGCKAWCPLYPTGHDQDTPVVIKENGHHQIVHEEENYFTHIRNVVSKLPSDYGKPIVIEFFLMRHALVDLNEKEENIECQVEAFFEQLDRIRIEFPYLYVVCGPALTVKNRPLTEDAYTVEALKMKKSNYIIATYAVKYNVPFVSQQGIVTSLPVKMNEAIWWTKRNSQPIEPVLSLSQEFKRQYYKNIGYLFDLISESHQQVLATIATAIEDETRLTLWENTPTEQEMEVPIVPKRVTPLKLNLSKRIRLDTECTGKMFKKYFLSIIKYFITW
jgi:hypothetical protein